MQNKELTNRQIFWILTNVTYGMTFLIGLTPVFQVAHQDAWMSILVATVFALLISFVVSKVATLYPTQTLVESSQTILGKWLGKAVVVPYFIAWYILPSVVMRQSSEAIKQLLLPRTPLFVIVLPLMFVALYLTYQGIEIIARANEMVGPVIYLSALVVTALLIRDMHWKQLLPLYPVEGWSGVLLGSLTPTSFMGESIIVLMIVPFMNTPKQLVSRSLWAVGLVGLILAMGAAIIEGVLSPTFASKTWYPAFEATQFISIGNFVQNLDALVIVIWLCAALLKIAICIYVISYGTAQLLKIKDWRHTIWFVGPITVVVALLPRSMVQVNDSFPTEFWVPYVVPIDMVFAPCLLWAVGSIRKKRAESKKSASPSLNTEEK